MAVRRDLAGAAEDGGRAGLAGHRAYGGGLADKPELLALNKADALDPATRKQKAKALKAAAGKPPFVVSGVSGEGVKELLRAAFAEVKARRAAEHIEQTAGEEPDQEWRP